MPFTNRDVAVIVANELNRHDRGMWFYKVERHTEGKAMDRRQGGPRVGFCLRPL